MGVDRLSTGEKIAGVGGVLLFAFTFFDWYSVEVPNGLVGAAATGGDAWDWLDVIPIVLMLAVVAAVGVAVVRLSDAVFEPAIPMNAAVAVLGGISALLILFRVLDAPGEGLPGVEVNPAIGIFLALLAAIAVSYGGYRAMREEGIAFSDVADRLDGERGRSGGSSPRP